jgi:hypothetical protein
VATILERTTPSAIGTSPFTSADLTSLAAGAYILGSNAITPPATATLLDFRLVLPSSITPTAGGTVTLFFLPQVDGTNYPNPPGSTTAAVPSQYYAGSYVFNGNATTVIDILNMRCPDYTFEVACWNNGSVSFPSSGTFTNTLYGKSYQMV